MNYLWMKVHKIALKIVGFFSFLEIINNVVVHIDSIGLSVLQPHKMLYQLVLLLCDFNFDVQTFIYLSTAST